MALMGAVTHFWILGDIFGLHPAEIEEGRYLRRSSHSLNVYSRPPTERATDDERRPWPAGPNPWCRVACC